jgi:peptidyl-prolyl cis-trans isomerase C
MNFRSGFRIAFVISLFLPTGPFADEAIVLKRGNIVVTAEDVRHYLETNTPEAQRAALLQRPGILREMAQNLYIVRSLSTAAQENTELDQDRLSWAAELDAARRRMEFHLTQQVEAVLANANWEQAAREIYAADGEKFVTPEQVRTEHILLTLEGRSEADAIALLSELRDRVLKGAVFAELAVEYSEDPTAVTNRGDLGFFGAGAMVPEFEAAAFSLAGPGSLSEPVKTQFGVHLIRLVERRKAGKREFDQVKGQIISELQKQTRQKLRQEQLVAIRSVPDIEWNDSVLDSLAEELGASPARVRERRGADTLKP